MRELDALRRADGDVLPDDRVGADVVAPPAVRVVGDPEARVSRIQLGVGYASPMLNNPDVDVIISGEQQESDGAFDSPAYALDAMAAGRLDAEGTSPATASALRLHADLVQLEARERRIASRFTSTHPEVPVAEVPAQPEDIHDLNGLRAVGSALADQS